MEVDKENLRSLSNDDLFKIMKKYGINVGPVNISVRSVYEKKLKNYLESIERKCFVANEYITQKCNKFFFSL